MPSCLLHSGVAARRPLGSRNASDTCPMPPLRRFRAPQQSQDRGLVRKALRASPSDVQACAAGCKNSWPCISSHFFSAPPSLSPLFLASICVHAGFFPSSAAQRDSRLYSRQLMHALAVLHREREYAALISTRARGALDSRCCVGAVRLFSTRGMTVRLRSSFSTPNAFFE